MSLDIDKEQHEIAESLRLRPAPAPITKVSRKALVAAGAAISLAIGGVVIWTSREHKPAERPEPVRPAPAKTPEGIAALPKDYLARGAPPPLGPPLPGDLGRPILSAQAGKGDAEQGALAAPAHTELASMAAERELQRRAELKAIRGSGLFTPTITKASVKAVVDRREEAIGGQVADQRLTSPERLQSPASPYVLQAGALIPAALITGLRSDAAGLAIAQVTQDVHDSLTGQHLLIPAGSKLIGEYGTQTPDGQQRLGVAWTRLTLPNGLALVLDKLPAADSQGMAGLQDKVDRHLGRVWSAAALSTVLSIGAEGGASSDDDLTRAIRRGVGSAVSDVGQQAVGRSLDLSPTLTIRPGTSLRVLLTRDLVLEPYKAGASR